MAITPSTDPAYFFANFSRPLILPLIGWPPLERWGWPPAWRVSGFYRAFNEASMGLHGRGAGCEGRPAGCRMGVQGGLLHASTWARTTTRRRRETTQLFTSSGHALVALDHHSWAIAHHDSGLNNTPFVLSVIDVTVMNRVMNRISYSTARLHKMLHRIVLPKWRKGWDSNPRLV